MLVSLPVMCSVASQPFGYPMKDSAESMIHHSLHHVARHRQDFFVAFVMLIVDTLFMLQAGPDTKQ